MKRILAGFSLIVILVFSWSTSVYAAMALGDYGKPADYNSTLRNFNSTLSNNLPKSFNWSSRGAVTPAKDQGSCGSCWAFAAVGVLESRILIAKGGNYDLSEQQQISCNRSQKACSGGNMNALKFWNNVNPMLEIDTDYCACNSSCANYSGDRKASYTVGGYYTINTNSINNMKISLYNHGPAYFRFNVFSDFFTFWRTYNPGKVYVQSTGSNQGGHAVLIIGWDNNKKAWLCKNSWGKNAGPNGNGTFWIAYSGHKNNLSFGMANITSLAKINK